MSELSMRQEETRIFNERVSNLILYLGSLDEFNRTYGPTCGEHEGIALSGPVKFYRTKLLGREKEEKSLVLEQGLDGFVDYNPHAEIGTPIRPKKKE